ncbi:PREDICTED: trafficking protein particle complex subunit 13 isoform X1 [Populus euphratica]|uniref:Trafficking protein particle complex subunit 13 isoform X1 n=1 Tax=Populus euphratica TaxID=75702 RepID=A0AAJ6UFG4_POPEU|nr:PREDICTED: trafficking protein particle complex subunit 13 isoform X1 [Populus euphratica]
MSTPPATQSLAFRVMRLCRPSFHVDTPLLLDPSDLILGEDIFDDPLAATHLPPLIDTHLTNPIDSSDLSYRSRFLLQNPSDSFGLSGLLVLPQSFGAIYLGETFCSYVSINNSSNFEVRDIVIKAEMQTERQRILLLDTSKTPVESIRASGRYDFIVEHDVKELGAHTLVCTALYTDGDGERKYLPQFFKFIVANPLSVRTKVRVVKETTYLEACIENHTKTNLYMDQVEFEPAPNWSAKILKADEHKSEDNSPSREIFKPPVLVKSGGGIRNYLYQLSLSSHGSAESNVLGKLQITWRTNLGEPGRLQTQQILGTPITPKEIELHVAEVPSAINLDRPFLVHLNLTNQTDRELGPFEVWLSQDDTLDEKTVMVNGLQTMELSQLEAFGTTDFYLGTFAVHYINDTSDQSCQEALSCSPWRSRRGEATTSLIAFGDEFQ